MKLPRTEKHLDAVYSCQRCAWCRASTYHDHNIQHICPIFEADENGGWEYSFARGHIALIRAMLEGRVEPTPELVKTFYKCTLCGNCETICSTNVAYGYGYQPNKMIEHVDLFETLRADFVELGLGPLPEHKSLTDSIALYDNPWYQPRSTRDQWTRRLKDIKIKDLNKEKAEVLLYVGCTASYDQNMRELAINTARVLSQAGVDFGILGKTEKCCGSTVLRCGVVDTYQRLAEHNIEQFRKLGVSSVVTPCSGCFKTIKQDYGKITDLSFEVVHTTVYFHRLIEEGKLKFREDGEQKVTWHDPCHLGRANGIFEEPREVIRAIPGMELVEMLPSGEYGMCCGAGGGVRTAFPDLATRIAVGRIDKALEAGAHTIVSACSFCENNLREGVQAAGKDVAIVDLGRIVAERMM